MEAHPAPRLKAAVDESEGNSNRAAVELIPTGATPSGSHRRVPGGGMENPRRSRIPQRCREARHIAATLAAGRPGHVPDGQQKVTRATLVAQRLPRMAREQEVRR